MQIIAIADVAAGAPPPLLFGFEPALGIGAVGFDRQIVRRVPFDVEAGLVRLVDVIAVGRIEIGLRHAGLS